jgi:hypothetical protein
MNQTQIWFSLRCFSRGVYPNLICNVLLVSDFASVDFSLSNLVVLLIIK